MALDKIDTSYWLVKDKAWMAEREAQWKELEPKIAFNRRKSEVTVIKNYFLKGKMPKWEKYKDWTGLDRARSIQYERHVDLAFFLWLHPSSDLEVLSPLYREYMESDLIHREDILSGYGHILGNELKLAAITSKSDNKNPFVFMGEKNITVFRVLFSDIPYAKQRINGLTGDDSTGERIFSSDYVYFLFMHRWLLQKAESPFTKACLYQYDEVLHWVAGALTEKSADELVNQSLKEKGNVEKFLKAFYCFYHFDTETEGDTPRSAFIPKIQKILDEGHWPEPFAKMWADVKAGRVEVKNPWKR